MTTQDRETRPLVSTSHSTPTPFQNDLVTNCQKRFTNPHQVACSICLLTFFACAHPLYVVLVSPILHPMVLLAAYLALPAQTPNSLPETFCSCWLTPPAICGFMGPSMPHNHPEFRNHLQKSLMHCVLKGTSIYTYSYACVSYILDQPTPKTVTVLPKCFCFLRGERVQFLRIMFLFLWDPSSSRDLFWGSLPIKRLVFGIPAREETSL